MALLEKVGVFHKREVRRVKLSSPIFSSIKVFIIPPTRMGFQTVFKMGGRMGFDDR